MRKSSKFLVAGALALAGAFGAGAAQARDNVYWSLGIHLPLDHYGTTIGTTIGNARPVYVQPAPVYYEPPVYYAPAPVVYAPAPIYYQPRPRVVYAPAPVYVPVHRYGPGHGRGHWRDHDHDRGGRHHRH